MHSPAKRLLPLLGVVVAAACGGAGAANDAPGGSSGGAAAGAPGRGPGGAAAPARTVARAPSLAAGAAVVLANRTGLSSWHNKVGDTVMAATTAPVADARGQTVIPTGAVFMGHVTAIAPAPHPNEQGTLSVTYSAVRINDRTYPVHVEVTSLATEMKGRGVTAGTVAKVGAGAAVGGVAGRVIGGNATGAVVGAVAGGAAGAVVANATRTMDIILSEGAAVHLKLTEPFVRPGAAGATP